IILNTDGWVREEEAVSYKLQLLHSLRPNLVLGLSSNKELDTIIEQQQWTTLRLEVSSYARTRTKEERKKTREEGYRRFFQNPKHQNFNLNTIKLRTFNKSRQQESIKIQHTKELLQDYSTRRECCSRSEELPESRTASFVSQQRP